MGTNLVSYRAVMPVARGSAAGAGGINTSSAGFLQQITRIMARAIHLVRAQEQYIGRLEDMIERDPVTGLQSRNGLRASLSRELSRCQRGLSHGGLLVTIEIDNLSAIRRRYGRPAGDAVLRLVARTLEQAIRPMDVAARGGDDAFVLLLSHTTKSESVARAQFLGQQLNNLAMALHGEEIPVRVTLSLQSYGKDDRIDRFFSSGKDGSANTRDSFSSAAPP